jgi:archaemetzincin
MKKINFYVFLVIFSVCAEGIVYYLASALYRPRVPCQNCRMNTGRSAQGAGAAAPAGREFTVDYEQDVTMEPYFPADLVFKGTTWNDIFQERGESYAAYRSGYKEGSAVRSIRIIPVRFKTAADGAILQQTRDFLEAAFSSKVSIQKGIELPGGSYDGARKQYDAGRILSGLLQNPWVHRRSNLNVVLIKDDMYARDLNYVFGYADYVHHVSVVSLYWLRARDKDLAQRRILKIVRHEVAHMYGLVHCTAPYCVMRGVNSLDELDASTLSLCNACASKLAWRLGDDGAARARALGKFYLSAFPGFFR